MTVGADSKQWGSGLLSLSAEILDMITLASTPTAQLALGETCHRLRVSVKAVTPDQTFHLSRDGKRYVRHIAAFPKSTQPEILTFISSVKGSTSLCTCCYGWDKASESLVRSDHQRLLMSIAGRTSRCIFRFDYSCPRFTGLEGPRATQDHCLILNAARKHTTTVSMRTPEGVPTQFACRQPGGIGISENGQQSVATARSGPHYYIGKTAGDERAQERNARIVECFFPLPLHVPSMAKQARAVTVVDTQRYHNESNGSRSAAYVTGDESTKADIKLGLVDWALIPRPALMGDSDYSNFVEAWMKDHTFYVTQARFEATEEGALLEEHLEAVPRAVEDFTTWLKEQRTNAMTFG